MNFIIVLQKFHVTATIYHDSDYHDISLANSDTITSTKIVNMG